MKYDRDEIVRDADSLQVAHALGMETRFSGQYVQIKCPGHLKRLGRPDRNFGSAWLTKHGYYCAACGKGGNVIDMVMEHSDLPFRDAIKFIAECNGGLDQYIIEEEDLDEFEDQTDEQSLLRPRKSQVRCIKYDEQKLIGLSLNYQERHPVLIFSEDPKELSKNKAFIEYSDLLDKRRALLNEVPSEVRKSWITMTFQTKSEMSNMPEKLSEVYRIELEMQKVHQSFSDEEKEQWKERCSADNRKRYIQEIKDACSIDLDGIEVEQVATLSDGQWVNEYIIGFSHGEALQTLYRTDYPAYLALVIRACKAQLEKYKKLQEILSASDQKYDIELLYILDEWIVKTKAILNDHENGQIQRNAA